MMEFSGSRPPLDLATMRLQLIDDEPTCKEWYYAGWRSEFSDNCREHNLDYNTNPCECTAYVDCKSYFSQPCSADINSKLIYNPCKGQCELPGDIVCDYQMEACNCAFPYPRCLAFLNTTTTTTTTTTSTTTTTPTSWLLSTTPEPGGGGGSEEENTWWHWVLIAAIAVAFIVLLLVFIAWRRKRK